MSIKCSKRGGIVSHQHRSLSDVSASWCLSVILSGFYQDSFCDGSFQWSVSMVLNQLQCCWTEEWEEEEEEEGGGGTCVKLKSTNKSIVNRRVRVKAVGGSSFPPLHPVLSLSLLPFLLLFFLLLFHHHHHHRRHLKEQGLFGDRLIYKSIILLVQLFAVDARSNQTGHESQTGLVRSDECCCSEQWSGAPGEPVGIDIVPRR